MCEEDWVHKLDVNSICLQDLKADTDIDLENIVYYKDDTHYFVMTAKKDSLLRKGVLREVSIKFLSSTVDLVLGTCIRIVFCMLMHNKIIMHTVPGTLAYL